MQSLDLDLLRTLVAIAETGNFSQAAQAVFRTPSAVSMQVKKMEEEVGTPLFVRDSRSVSLTEDGERLLIHARRMLALHREMMAEFREDALKGTVRLGIQDDVAERFLPEMLRRFSASHPGVAVNALILNSHEAYQKIAEGRLDVAIISRLTSQRLERPAEVLLREQIVWAGCKSGIAHEEAPIPVSVWEECCEWRRAGLGALEKAGIAYRIAFESGHTSVQRAAISADLAIAPMPRSAIEGCITEVPRERGLPALPVYELGLITKKDLSEPAAAAADHLRASFATQALAAA
ncbi:MAG: LysR family transcriptional regulator [Pseudomonadota bacterium]